MFEEASEPPPAATRISRYIHESVPPPSLVDRRERLEARLETPTGRFDLQEVMRATEARFNEAANHALEAELKERKEKEKITNERIWQVLLAMLLLLAGGALAKLGWK